MTDTGIAVPRLAAETISPPVDPRLVRPLPPPPAGRVSRVSRSRLWATGVAICAVVASLIYSREGLGVIALLFVVVVPFEKLFPRHLGQRIRRPQLVGDLAFALTSPILNLMALAVAVPLAIASLAWLPGLLLRPVVASLPPAVLPVAGVLLFDFVVYWTHRWGHEVPFFWRFHSIHHSTEHLDWISGFRNHPFDGAFIAPAFVFLIAAGFDAELSGAIAVVQVLIGLFLHANVRWRLRPLHRIIITPEFHHWHHSNERDAHRSNYSVFLPVWDVVFGTYFMPKNRRPKVYGVDEEIPVGLVAQLMHPLRGIGNPIRVIRHPLCSLRGGLVFSRRLLGQMWKSARRPTHSAGAGKVRSCDSPQAGRGADFPDLDSFGLHGNRRRPTSGG